MAVTGWTPAQGPLGRAALHPEQRRFPVQPSLAAVSFQHLVDLLHLLTGFHEVHDLQV